MCLHVSGVRETEREGGVKVASELGGGGVYWLYRLCIIDDDEREKEREGAGQERCREGRSGTFIPHSFPDIRRSGCTAALRYT